MKKNILLFLLLLLLCAEAPGQNLIIKGRVRCLNQSAHSTKGAENIIVVPTFKPSRSAITATSPTGYFEFNTGIPLTTLQDKQVQIYIVSGCGQCKDIVKRVFISEDQDRQNKDDSKSYVTVRNWLVDKNCSQIELNALRADSALQVIQQQPEQKLSELKNTTAITGSPALLNLLTTLTTVLVPVPPATGLFQIINLEEGDINYGKFLFASALTHTLNAGFNFAPARDLAEAPFWNPAALAFSKSNNNISLLTNAKNNAKLGSYFKLSERFSLGACGIFTRQDEFRDAFGKKDPYDAVEIPKFIDSLFLKLKEYAVFVSPSYKVNNRLAFGLSFKSIWQDLVIPVSINIQRDADDNPTNEITTRQIKKQHFDVDFSAAYKVSKSFQVGLNATNLAGTTLYADAFAPQQQVMAYQKQRALGIGGNYKWQRFNFGTDAIFTEAGFYDAAIGINFVPFNEGLLAASYAIEQSSYTIALRLKHFRLAYLHDNDFLVNEKRKGKASILNGRLYGGFTFDF